MAELPLVATAATARRQGHCRILMTAIEEQLQVNVWHVFGRESHRELIAI